MKIRYFIAILFAGMISQLCADDEAIHHIDVPQGVWFTGPLLAPSGYTTPPGQYNVEPYLFYTVNSGNYNNHWHSISQPNFTIVRVEVPTKIGIIQRLDFAAFPRGYYQSTQGQHSINIGDLPFNFGIQVIPAKMRDPWPAVKLNVRASAPLGKYEHLNPAKEGTDSMGTGSWYPGMTLIFAKLWDVKNAHVVEGRLAVNYQWGTPVSVEGYNTYGGTFTTKGTVYPGNLFWMDASIQYNFTQNWAFACDLLYNHRNKDRFSGIPGEVNGSPASVTRPSSEQLSLAPAIEYNFSKYIGIISGVWFSIAGRNSAQFISGVIAVNIHI